MLDFTEQWPVRGADEHENLGISRPNKNMQVWQHW